jgi:hypothetical protein
MPIHTIGLAILAAGLAIACARMIVILFRYSGAHVVTCPETHQPAGVDVDRSRALRTGLFSPPNLRLANCSRWPERAGCGQECLSQIEAAPQGCLVRNIVGKWYEGKVCASCKLPFHEIQWQVSKPALLLADKTSVEWNRVPAERLQEVLATAEPLCCSCYLAARIVAERPDLAVERPSSWTHSESASRDTR